MARKTYTFEALGLVDNGTDPLLSNITVLASRLLNSTVSLLSVIQLHRDRQYISAASGIPAEDESARQVTLEQSVCKIVCESDSLIVIPDLLEDPRTNRMQSVTDNGMRAYIGAPIHNVDGKPIGALCCLMDEPTEWGPIRIDSLKRLAYEIDDIIRTRTHALELEAANGQLNKVLSSRSSFISHFSHEMRTPLTGLLGSIRLLSRMKLDGYAGDLVQVMSRSAKNMLEMVNDTLDLAKLDAGQYQLESVPCDLGHLAREVVSSFRAVAEDKGLEVWVDDQLAGAEFITDIRALSSILQNLFSNAIKFTEVGSAGVVLQRGQYGLVEIQVVDTGIGIDAEAQAIIFDEFQQANPSIARKYGGTGLGMTIVKRMVDAMNGDIWIKSEPGQGTTFVVWLPLEPAAVPQPSQYPNVARPQLDDRALIV